MKYLLDTDICIYLINGDKTLISKVKDTGVFSIGISNVTLAELYYGAYLSEYVESNISNIIEFRKNLTVYSDNSDSAEAFGLIKSTLKQSGKIIEDFDILIASIAIANDCVLVTNNIRHFQRIPNLEIENWLETK